MKNKLPSCLSQSDINFIKKNAGKIKRQEIADKLNVSIATLKRAAKYLNISFALPKKYNSKIVNDVLDYYKIHGKLKTKEKYNDVKFRSIVEKYGYKKNLRFIPWKFEEILLSVRLSGLFNCNDIAKYINRGAKHASITTTIYRNMFNLKVKNIRKINGLSRKEAIFYVYDNCPCLKTTYTTFNEIFLYCDMEKHLKKNLNKNLIKHIKLCAKIQKWLWSSNEPKNEILKLYNKVKKKLKINL